MHPEAAILRKWDRVLAQAPLFHWPVQTCTPDTTQITHQHTTTTMIRGIELMAQKNTLSWHNLPDNIHHASLGGAVLLIFLLELHNIEATSPWEIYPIFLSQNVRLGRRYRCQARWLAEYLRQANLDVSIAGATARHGRFERCALCTYWYTITSPKQGYRAN